MSLDIRFSSLKMYFAFLGEGGFGIVAKCRDTMTNRAVAIKLYCLLPAVNSSNLQCCSVCFLSSSGD
uniref:Protein kinase domain-containing protein n=1 Tax=Maylandia zebra TaxID=106582 RepID=A0A3P9BVY5_9CICH